MSYDVKIEDAGNGYEARNRLRIVHDGKTVDEHLDYCEPEDNSFTRDWSWVPDELERAYQLGLKDAGGGPKAELLAIESIRASATPMAFLCPGSIRRGELLISEDSEAATMGTVGHIAFRALAETGAIDWENLPRLAEDRGVDLEELRMLCAQATNLWKEVRNSFPSAVSEVSLMAQITDSLSLTGHLDLLSISGRVARVADWKTGRKDTDYAHQLRAYATLVFQDDPEIEEVTSTALWVRESEIENYTITRADARQWVSDLMDRVVQWDGVWHPGQHCRYCKRSHECASANAMVRRDVAALLDQDIDRAAETLAAMTPQEIVALNQKVDIVRMYAGRLHEAIKTHVQYSGPVVGNGVRLEVIEEKRRELDAAKALPVLQQTGLTVDDIGSCTKISVSKVEKLVSQRAGRGLGAGAVRALTERLAAAGAVSQNIICKLQERRA